MLLPPIIGYRRAWRIRIGTATSAEKLHDDDDDVRRPSGVYLNDRGRRNLPADASLGKSENRLCSQHLVHDFLFLCSSDRVCLLLRSYRGRYATTDPRDGCTQRGRLIESRFLLRLILNVHTITVSPSQIYGTVSNNVEGSAQRNTAQIQSKRVKWNIVKTMI